MSVEYWNREKEEWIPSFGMPEDEVERVNLLVGWEMYRKAE